MALFQRTEEQVQRNEAGVGRDYGLHGSYTLQEVPDRDRDNSAHYRDPSPRQEWPPDPLQERPPERRWRRFIGVPSNCLSNEIPDDIKREYHHDPKRFMPR